MVRAGGWVRRVLCLSRLTRRSLRPESESVERSVPLATDIEGRTLPWSSFFDTRRERATRPPEVRFAVEPALLTFYKDVVEGKRERDIDTRMKRWCEPPWGGARACRV